MRLVSAPYSSLLLEPSLFDSFIPSFGLGCYRGWADDTDLWVGHRICLFQNIEPVAGKMTPCVRVRAVAAPLKKASAPAPKKVVDDDYVADDEPPPHTEAPPFNDDIEL